MNPDHLLGIVNALAGFVLKTILAFVVCLALSWLAGSPSKRFVVWLGFLYGSAIYWLWLAKGVLGAGRLSEPVAHSLTPAVSALQIPGSWAFPLAAALRGIGIAYLLILGYLLFIHFKKHRQLNWVLGFTSQPPSEIAEAFRPLAKKLHVGRSRLLVLSGVTSPATFGWVRPTILLPDACLEQDRSELEDILRHELHHVRRWDFVWNGFAVACRALLFFHPAAWYAVRKMQLDRELACDLAVVSDSPTSRAKYAECLVHFARLHSTQDARNWGIDFAASSAHLKARIHSILVGSKKTSVWSVCSRSACGLALLAGFVAIEPSLGVMLTYAQQQIVKPLTAEVRTTSPKTGMRVRATRKGRPSTVSLAATADAAVAGLTQTTLPAGSTAPNTDGSSRAQSDVGPHLLHRGSPDSGTDTKPQTVILIDDSSGQTSKAGDRDRKQALQQSAAAALGIYKGLSDFDRH
jgi:beta-lactamase regulating signal transducer with metallopeptidase domain